MILGISLLISCGSSATQDSPVVLSRDGGWCWFQDPRAIVHDGKLVVGTVANGLFDSLRTGDVEALVYDFRSEELTKVELYDRLQADDHNSPVFAVRPDGRLLTVFAQHGDENRFYYRISWTDDLTGWGPVRQYIPSESTRITYSNLHVLTGEANRIYNFFRGLDDSYKPSYVYSDDLGETWTTGNVFIDVPTQARHRPYVRYKSNGEDAIHIVYTEGHPRVYDNSVYHVYYADGDLHNSDGRVIRSLAEGLTRPEEGTRIFRGDSSRVPWVVDLELDSHGNPYVAYSVQVGSAGLPPGKGGDDLRYRYARWNGRDWEDHSLAYAGTRLYAGEDDYSGLVALDPDDPNVLYISTNADPVTGEPLISETDGERHYEIYRGLTDDRGVTWRWTSVTQNSEEDNLRPVVPEREEGRTFLLWLRGEYRSYTDYSLEVVGKIVND